MSKAVVMPKSLQYPALVIPAYQPDRRLLQLVQTLRERRGQQYIIVVDDGSAARTQTLFAQLRDYQVDVLRHSHNLGKGQALKTAFAHYLHLAGDAALGVVTADADGQHAVDDILAVSDALNKAPNCLYLGVRDFSAAAIRAAGIPWRSRMGNVLTGYIFRKISATALYDTQTGLRGIPVNLIQSVLNSKAQGYELEMEMLLLAARDGIQIYQIPIKTIYFDRNVESHFHPLRDSIKIYSTVVRFLLRPRKKSEIQS